MGVAALGARPRLWRSGRDFPLHEVDAVHAAARVFLLLRLEVLATAEWLCVSLCAFG